MARLVIDEEGSTRFHRLTQQVTSIGRADGNLIRIEDIKSSRHHCEIHRDADGYRLLDLGSGNGTRVNHLRIEQERALADGDVIEIGSTKLTFEAEARQVLELDGQPAEEEDPNSGTVEIVRRRGRGRSRRRRRAAPAPPTVAPEGITRLADQLTATLRELLTTFDQHGVGVAHRTFEQVLGDRGATVLRRYQDRIDKLEQVAQIAGAINSEHDLKRLLERIIDAAIELTGAERGFLVLVSDGKMAIEVARHFERSSLSEGGGQLSQSVARQVADSGEVILTGDAQQDPRLGDVMSVMDLSLRSVICLPLRLVDEVIGVIYLDDRRSTDTFDPRDVDILEAFCDQAATAIANARLLAENIDRRREVDELNRKLEARVQRQADDLASARELIDKQASALADRYGGTDIVGRSKPMRKLFGMLDRVKESQVPVLITGESGTGKEMFARAIHSGGPRAEGPFVGVNCAALTPSLLESELFGHVKGAFTGAERARSGLLVEADGGTLFLDEIGDMPAEMQAKLLRALQDREVRPVGATEPVPFDARLISATHRDLRSAINDGAFREDLLYRINAIELKLPPLRERREDIPPLAEHLIEALCRREGAEPRTLDKRAIALLKRHDWPGNVRELENELHRAIALSEGVIRPRDLSPSLRDAESAAVPEAAPARPGGYELSDEGLKALVKRVSEEVEREVIAAVLAEEKTKAAAAKRLGVSRPTLDAKIESLGIVWGGNQAGA